MDFRVLVVSAVGLVLGCGFASREPRADGAAVRPEAESEPPAPVEPAPEEPTPREDVPPPAEPEPAAPPVCLAPLPTLPAALPEDGRRCLEGLASARERFAFLVPPWPELEPCAIEELRDDGTVYWRGNISRPSPTETRATFGPIDDGGQRMSMRRTTHRDGKGRMVRQDEVWDQFVEGFEMPDCTNTSETRHTLERKGWPRKSKTVIESCEGVDAGVVTTNRRFTSEEGLVTATLSIVDRGTKLKGTAWWMPDPARPLAWGVTDHYEDVECWLEVRGCDGAVLGRMHGRDEGNVDEVERHVWACAEAG